MILSQYLFTSPNGNYFLRIRTPKNLKETIGLTEIKRSLGTPDLALATKRALPYLDFIERMKSMSGISKILSGVGKFSVDKISAGDVEIESLQVDADKEGDVEAAIEFVNATIGSQVGNSLPASPPEPESKKISLKQLIQDFIQEKHATGSWTDKTRAENTQLFELLLRLVGEDLTTSQLNYEVAREAKKILLQLPANLSKPARYRNKTLEQIIELGDKPRSTTTANKILVRYSGLFGWAKRHGYIKDNYFEGLTLKESKNKKEQRAAYSNEQLEILFTTLNNSQQDHSYQYWLPRIALLSGMRLNEICQLHLSDIRLGDDDDTLIFDINDDKEKTLKNNNAKRKVPIHKLLLDNGLINRVIELKQKGETRLFPELSHDGNSYGTAPSKWFGSIRRKLGWVNQTPKLDFHSFRHNTATFLQQKDIPEYRIAFILGHEVGSGETFNRYGKGFTLSTLHGDINTIDYPHIKSHLTQTIQKNSYRR